MERKILYLLVIVGVLYAEAKIMMDHGIGLKGNILKDKLLSGMPQLNDKLLRRLSQVNDKLIIGKPQMNKADATTRFDSSNELFSNFYKYKTSTTSSPGAASNITTCIAASRTPPIVKMSVYAHRAAGGTLFLRHRVGDDCFGGCFQQRRSETLTADTFESCADAVESSGWANSFTFIEDACTGYAAWMHSKFTQGSFCDGDVPVFAAEKKINNFTDYASLTVLPFRTLSRNGFYFYATDLCLTTAKVKVTTQSGSKTFENFATYVAYFYFQFNIDLCSMNHLANTINFTSYDFDGAVLGEKTVQRLGPAITGGAMHPFSGNYGDLCVYQLDSQYAYETGNGYNPCENVAAATEFRETSFLTFAGYRQIISTIPGGAPNHFVWAYYYGTDGTWRWGWTNQPIGAEDFVSSTFPNNDNGSCLIVNSEKNYLLEPFDCSTPNYIVCVDFSGLSDPFNFALLFY